MKNKIDKCIACKDKPIHIKKRKLCVNCYQRTRKYNGLPVILKKELEKHKRNRLVEKYGSKIIDDFNMLGKNPAWTLITIGEKYGFTREYARQLCPTVLGDTYGNILKNKMVDYKKDTGCPNDPRHKFAEYERNGSNCWKSAKTEKMFFDECVRRGFDIEVLCNSKIDIKINGYLVDVKSCFSTLQPSKSNTTPYRRFKISKTQIKECDFLACYHGGEKTFFIIPRKEFPSCLGLYISEVTTDYYNSKNRYWEYKDAWNLLGSSSQKSI